MSESYRSARPRATRPPRVRPGLLVMIDGRRPVVRVVAENALELEELLPIAALVETVVATALRRRAGAA